MLNNLTVYKVSYYLEPKIETMQIHALDKKALKVWYHVSGNLIWDWVRDKRKRYCETLEEAVLFINGEIEERIARLKYDIRQAEGSIVKLSAQTVTEEILKEMLKGGANAKQT